MVRCLFTREYIGRLTCYQQRPDGQWVHMVDLNPAFADSGAAWPPPGPATFTTSTAHC